MRAILALEDGRIFIGESFGARDRRVGEVCFNTSMTGYQEVLTDPSYRGQIVAMTYPLIGNYGVNELDQESANRMSAASSSRNSARSRATGARKILEDYLRRWNIPGCKASIRAR